MYVWFMWKLYEFVCVNLKKISVWLFLLKSIETLTKIKVRFYHVVLVVTVGIHGWRAFEENLRFQISFSI